MQDGADRPDAVGTVQVAADPARLLQIWLSPAFPVGAFAYSHGLEQAVEAGWIGDKPTLQDWLADLLAHGALRNDLILLAAAWRAVTAGDDASLAETVALSVALQPSAERHLEATQQGASFLDQIAASWPCAGVDRLRRVVGSNPIGYPVAVGAAAAGRGIPLAAALPAFALAWVGTLVSSSIRLSVIGQTDGQRAIAALMPALEQAASAAKDATLADLGGAAFRSDIASLAHETQYSRLFRS